MKRLGESRLISLKCENCQGSLEVDSGKEILFCPYCGSRQLITESDEVKIAQIQSFANMARIKADKDIARINKEAEIEKVRVEIAEKARIEREKEKRETKYKIIAVCVVLLPIVLFIIYQYIEAIESGALWM